MPRYLLHAGAFALASVVAAQSTTVVPAICTALPGNAALSLPLRWSHGTMQVFVDAIMLPSGLVGPITGVRLRRPTFLSEPAYAALQRTLTVRGGFQSPAAATMGGSLTQNRPANTLVLFGPAPVTAAAAPGPGPTTTTGQEFLQIPFTQPLPVVAGTLFLEFETSDAPLQISNDHWVDAIWFENGFETGYAMTVGDGSCTTRSVPTQLRWSGAPGPVVGGNATMELVGAPPTIGTSHGFVLMWAGLEPQASPVGPGYLGFGGSFGLLDPGLLGCHMWAPLDGSWLGSTNAQGTYTTSFPLAGGATLGMKVGVQAAWLDPNRAGLPLSFSNGLMLVLNWVGVGSQCNTVFFPAGLTVSPWVPFVGQMPVLVLEH